MRVRPETKPRLLTAAKLREIAAEYIASTIESHRDTREFNEEPEYERPEGDVTDEEISAFLFHNPLLDEETVGLLLDDGPLVP